MLSDVGSRKTKLFSIRTVHVKFRLIAFGKSGQSRPRPSRLIRRKMDNYGFLSDGQERDQQGPVHHDLPARLTIVPYTNHGLKRWQMLVKYPLILKCRTGWTICLSNCTLLKKIKLPASHIFNRYPCVTHMVCCACLCQASQISPLQQHFEES